MQLSIERLQNPQDVIHHWLGIRADIDANNFQDTTVEQRAYPFYVQTLNRLCYQKMLDL